MAELSRETHLVQMTTQASFFADQEKNKQFHPRMRLKESLNTKGDHCSSNSRIDQKLTHKRGLECNGEKKHGGRRPCEVVCWLLLSFCADFSFCPAPSYSQIKLNDNHQNKHSIDCGLNLPSYPLPYFLHKEFIDNIGLDQMRRQDITPHPCFYFPQQYWKMSSNKLESCFVKRVNTHKGCWYHSWQDHNPGLMMSNQINDKVSPLPPDSVSCNNYEGPQAINLNLVLSKESTPMKDVGTTVDKTTIPV